MAYATVDELAAALRIAVTAANTEALQTCLDAAAIEIDDTIDAPAEIALPRGTWAFDTATAAADPGPGLVRLNRTTPAATTEIYADEEEQPGVAAASFADELPTTGDVIRMEDHAAASRFEQFAVTGPAIDETGWVRIPVDRTATSGTLVLAAGTFVDLVFYRPSRPVGNALALANRVNIVRGVEWWKAQDAAFGVLGSTDLGPVRAPKDQFARHALELVPLKQRFGVG